MIEQELTFASENFEELKNSPDILATYGKMPSFENSRQKEEWLDILYNIGIKVRDEPQYDISDYMYPNGSIVEYGLDSNGYLVITLVKGKNLEKPYSEFYKMFDIEGQKNGIDSVPLVFEYGEVPIEASRASSWRPIIGGIKICTEKPDGIMQSTLGFSAQTSSGTKGYVVAGHAASSIGDQIWQPTAGPSANKVGTVSKVGGHYADASWVPYSNVAARIYDTDTDVLKDVKSYAANPLNGSTVFMSGISSGKKSGTVNKISFEVTSPTFGTLYNQCRANYSSTGGDSGAPVYVYVSGGVEMVGINWGYASVNSYFSPVSGIQNDLGVTPLKV